MADEQMTANAEHSLDAVAGTLITEPKKAETRPQAKRPEPPQPREIVDTAAKPADGGDPADIDDDDDDIGDFLDDLSGNKPKVKPREVEGDDAPDDDDDAPDDDNKLIRVKQNGEYVDVTLADLKRSWAGGKGIDARMQEAAEQRNAMAAAREQAEGFGNEVRALYDRLLYVYQNHNAAMFLPRVERPDPSMQHVDPIGYFSAMEDYREDQSRIANEQAQAQHAMQQAQAIMDAQRQERLKTEKGRLAEKFPGLAKPETARAFRERINAIGKAHGFTAEEIAAVDDHRMLTIAAEAAAYRDLKERLEGKRQKGQPVTRRPMPTRGENKSRGEIGRKASAARKANQKARETGRVEDVAATLLF